MRDLAIARCQIRVARTFEEVLSLDLNRNHAEDFRQHQASMTKKAVVTDLMLRYASMYVSMYVSK